MEKQNTTNSRIIILDILRIVSAAGVVIKHTLVQWLMSFAVWSSSWIAINVLNSFWRWSVPVFLMITGIVLLRPDKLDDDRVEFYKTRLTKVIIPFLVVIACFLGFDILTWRFTWWYDAVRAILSNGYQYHLWYVLTILGVYFITPFLRIILKHGEVKLLHLYIYLWIWFKVMNLILLHTMWISFGATPSWFTWIDAYVIIWYCIRYTGWLSKINTKRLVLAYVLWWIATAAGTYYISIQSGTYNEFMLANNMPNIIIMSVAIIAIARQNYEKIPANISSPVRKLSKTSFGVYLYHPLFIHLAYYIVSDRMGIFWLKWLMIIAILAVIFTWSFVYIVQKIPGGKNIIPET